MKMKFEDADKKFTDNSEFDFSKIPSGLVISAIIAFVMVLNSIVNTDVGGIFQQILIR
jgi:hypothetical protein